VGTTCDVLQLDPLKIEEEPDTSTAAQKVADVHEMESGFPRRSSIDSGAPNVRGPTSVDEAAETVKVWAVPSALL